MPFGRTTKPKIYDARNPEYSLVDFMVSEQFSLHSPEIKYWSFLRDDETNSTPRDELDKIYGELSSGKESYLGPYDVEGVLEINPIVKEFTRLGLQQIEEIEFIANIAAMDTHLNGRPPKPGDVFRITWIVTETDRRFVFYKVANVKPIDPYNFKYVNWMLHCEQTTLHEVSDEIKLFSESE